MNDFSVPPFEGGSRFWRSLSTNELSCREEKVIDKLLTKLGITVIERKTWEWCAGESFRTYRADAAHRGPARRNTRR